MARFSATEHVDRVGYAARPERSVRRKGPSLSTIILVSMFILGAGIIAYPSFSDWWNSFHQTRAIASYVMAVEEADPRIINAMLDEAKAYNQKLLSKHNRFILTEEEEKEYASILDLTGSGIMGYVQVPKIGISYPIYHGMEEKVLQIAIGHIEGTSFPVGGATTHAAISGHRGLPRAKLFTDLDQLVEGDLFMVTILNETHTYEIDQIRIVLPEEMNDLNFIEGADLITLITCTPYGINTHRLLVRGHRVENVANLRAIPAEAVQIPNYIAVPAVGIPMLFTYLVASLLYYRFHDKGYDKEGIMAALDQMKDGDALDDDGT